jgi:hypothetical protein
MDISVETRLDGPFRGYNQSPYLQRFGFWYYEVSSKYAGSSTKTLGFSFFHKFVLNKTDSGITAALSFVGTPGSTYEVQRAVSPGGPWETLSTVSVPSPSDGFSSFVDTNLPPDSAFYRLKQE